MRSQLIVFSMFLLLFAAACTKQDGMVAGTVAPPGAGARVEALQNGKTVAAASPDSRNGAFRLVLAPGAYDISVSAPSSPFPLTFSAVRVEPGKTTDLSRIELAAGKGNAVLAGCIVPAGAATTVTLFADGRERAAMPVDRDGNFRFTELSAGTYTLQAGAPEYARDAVALTVADTQTVTQNFRLLYASDAGGVDWAAGKIRVTGVGLPPAGANATVRREMARRAALADGERKLVKAIARIKVGPGQSLRSFWGERNFTERIRGFVRGYKVVGERETDGGGIEIDLELPLTGPGGLSRYLGD